MVDIDTCLLMVRIYQKILSLQSDLDYEKAINPPDYKRIEIRREQIKALKSIIEWQR
jgi:hypothetical protein